MRKKKLRRKTFDELIEDAKRDFLKSDEYYIDAYSFHPSETPNRNPEQVTNGMWCRLIYKHVNKNYYN